MTNEQLQKLARELETLTNMPNTDECSLVLLRKGHPQFTASPAATWSAHICVGSHGDRFDEYEGIGNTPLEALANMIDTYENFGD